MCYCIIQSHFNLIQILSETAIVVQCAQEWLSQLISMYRESVNLILPEALYEVDLVPDSQLLKWENAISVWDNVLLVHVIRNSLRCIESITVAEAMRYIQNFVCNVLFLYKHRNMSPCKILCYHCSQLCRLSIVSESLAVVVTIQ